MGGKLVEINQQNRADIEKLKVDINNLRNEEAYISDNIIEVLMQTIEIQERQIELLKEMITKSYSLEIGYGRIK